MGCAWGGCCLCQHLLDAGHLKVHLWIVDLLSANQICCGQIQQNNLNQSYILLQIDYIRYFKYVKMLEGSPTRLLVIDQISKGLLETL